MDTPETFFSQVPTHPVTPAAILEAKEVARLAWAAYDEHSESRNVIGDAWSFQASEELYQSACAAEEWLAELRDARLNGRTPASIAIELPISIF